jgi:hypothetical protein
MVAGKLSSKAWRFLRKWGWIVLLGAGIVAFTLWRIVRNPPKKGEVDVPPLFLETAKDQVARVQLEAEVEKARVTATADVHRAEIDRIEKLGQDEPRVARRQMAEWLTLNL